MMRDNLFEIVTSSRTFYVQVRYFFGDYRFSYQEINNFRSEININKFIAYANKKNMATVIHNFKKSYI